MIREAVTASPLYWPPGWERAKRPTHSRFGDTTIYREMRELGRRSSALHADLAEPVTANGVDLVFAAGEMRALYDRLPRGVGVAHGETGADLIDDVMRIVRAGDVVMVKGSNASRMTAVVEALLDAGGMAEDG